VVLKVSRSITSVDVIEFFQGLFVAHGVPEHICSDSGPEFIAQGLRTWLGAAQVGPLYVVPASPWENGDAESCHSQVRDEFLECEVFETVRDAQAWGTAWRQQDHAVRPPMSLGSRTPAEFARACAASAPASAAPWPALQPHTLTNQPTNQYSSMKPGRQG
jgi:putative transposase